MARRQLRVPEEQRSFAAVDGDAAWEPPARRPRPVSPWLLSPTAAAEVERFAAVLEQQGRLARSTIRTYRQNLAALAKLAHRHLGRPLGSMGQLIDARLIQALARDDNPLIASDERLSHSSVRARRRVLRKYIATMGVPGLTFERANEILDEGLSRAAHREGSRYRINAGRRARRRPGPKPTKEEFDQLLGAASTTATTFIGARNAALLLVAAHTGLRRSSVVALDGGDFSSRHGQVFVTVREKGRPQPRERELPERALQVVKRYVGAFNGTAGEKGWPWRIGTGVAGPFWRGEWGRPLGKEGASNIVRDAARACGLSFRFHDLRHLFSASLIEGLSSPADAAAAGEWQGDEVFLRHYAHPARRWLPENPSDEPPAEEPPPSCSI